MKQTPGFGPDQLRARYDVVALSDDPWHSYSGDRTAQLIAHWLAEWNPRSRVVLNAGAGVHELNLKSWDEVCVDLFEAPIRSHKKAVCANIEQLPFDAGSFGVVVCVGEVLGYCDAARAIGEFSRVLDREGLLICDFGSTRSLRHWATPVYGHAVGMITDIYNGSAERIWIYDPNYVCSVLRSHCFRVSKIYGTHTWSSLIRRIGLHPTVAVRIEKLLHRIPLSRSCADVTTIVAVRI